jgi:hypothetical protein
VTERPAYDLINLGLGKAGAALARAAARRGLRVFGIDSKPLGEAGARWVNGVPRWCFEAAEIDPPRHPELRAEGEGFHMIAGWGPRRVTVPSAGLLEVDMRALVARLQAEAAAAGATLRGELRATGLVQAGAGWSVALSSGERVEAALVVDAAGLGGCGLVSSHRPDRRDLCVAAQAVHEIADIDAAKAFFAKHNVPVGDAAVFTGVAGGYSIVNVRADISQRAAKDGDAPPTISILTGAIPGGGHTPGTVLLERFLEANPWIGPRIFGGARAIPIGPPAGALFEGGVRATAFAWGARWLGAGVNRTWPGLAHVTDLGATLLEAAGVAPLPPLPGRNVTGVSFFAPLAAAAAASARADVVINVDYTYPAQAAIVLPRGGDGHQWKLILGWPEAPGAGFEFAGGWSDRDGLAEAPQPGPPLPPAPRAPVPAAGPGWPLSDMTPTLFDLAADPRETTNLTDAFPDVVAELTARLAPWGRAAVAVVANNTVDPRSNPSLFGGSWTPWLGLG